MDGGRLQWEKKSGRGESSSVVKTTNQRGIVIPEGPWKHLQKILSIMYKYTGEGEAGWSRLNVMNDIMNCGPGPSPLWPAVNIFLSSPGTRLKRNFVRHDMCFLLPDRTAHSLRRISRTMSPSRADCRTEWAAGWPEPTSYTAEPAGNTSRSWPTRGLTQTATTEPCMVRTTTNR